MPRDEPENLALGQVVKALVFQAGKFRPVGQV